LGRGEKHFDLCFGLFLVPFEGFFLENNNFIQEERIELIKSYSKVLYCYKRFLSQINVLFISALLKRRNYSFHLHHQKTSERQNAIKRELNDNNIFINEKKSPSRANNWPQSVK